MLHCAASGCSKCNNTVKQGIVCLCPSPVFFEFPLCGNQTCKQVETALLTGKLWLQCLLAEKLYLWLFWVKALQRFPFILRHLKLANDPSAEPSDRLSNSLSSTDPNFTQSSKYSTDTSYLCHTKMENRQAAAYGRGGSLGLQLSVISFNEETSFP